ncbi:MAG: glycosyltransferase family 2 protein [Proteobacteria bacterium]|nr:glycosyltransferase family 2 protein [Pseudomonadota bacterium]
MADYALTTPALNERENLPRLLASLVDQDLPPALWLVVDDGSTDGSWEWLQEQAAEVPWLEVRRSPETSDEYLGHHIARIKAWGLDAALSTARERDLDLLAVGVLDADLSLPPDHYRRLLEAFEGSPRLGVASSLIAVDGEPPERFQRSDLPRGGTQTFRVACLEEIGGLPPYSGFDGAANVKARLAGWETRLLTDVVAGHARETGTRFGIGPGYARKGRYAWFLDLHPAIVAARTVAYTVASPHTGGVHFLRGWLGSAVRRKARCPDDEVRAYYRRERPREYLRSLRGKGPGFVR